MVGVQVVNLVYIILQGLTQAYSHLDMDDKREKGQALNDGLKRITGDKNGDITKKGTETKK